MGDLSYRGKASVIAAILVLGWSLPLRGSFSRSPPDSAFFAIDLGGYVPHLDEQLGSPNALQDLKTNVLAYLRARLGIPLSGELFLEPSLGSLLPWKVSADGTTKIFQFTLELDFSYPLFSFLRFRTGPGVFSWVYLPGADSVTLNNGTSTATFYTPDRFAATLQFQVGAGLELVFSRVLSLFLEGFIIDPVSAPLRQLNASVVLGIHL